jgi:hypothetical protein
MPTTKNHKKRKRNSSLPKQLTLFVASIMSSVLRSLSTSLDSIPEEPQKKAGKAGQTNAVFPTAGKTHCSTEGNLFTPSPIFNSVSRDSNFFNQDDPFNIFII